MRDPLSLISRRDVRSAERSVCASSSTPYSTSWPAAPVEPSRPHVPAMHQRVPLSALPGRKDRSPPRVCLQAASADHCRHSDLASAGPSARLAVSSREVCPTPALRTLRFDSVGATPGQVSNKPLRYSSVSQAILDIRSGRPNRRVECRRWVDRCQRSCVDANPSALHSHWPPPDALPTLAGP
jgi:hypothetical protein